MRLWGRIGRLRWLLPVVLALLGIGQPARAQVSLSGFYAFDGAMYSYNLYVTNNGLLDLAIATLTTPADPMAVQNPRGPIGFETDFDSDLGLLSFLEDSDDLTPKRFSPGSTSGFFSFESPFFLDATDFEALDLDGNSFTGTLSVSAAPEPSSLALTLGALSALALVGFLRHRKLGTV